MAELTPEQKAKLAALDPDEVAAEVGLGRQSGYAREKMDYLIRLNEKYKQTESLKVMGAERSDFHAKESIAKEAKKRNKLLEAAGKWTPYVIAVMLLAIVVSIALSR